MPNTDSTRKFVKRFFDADAPLPKDNLHIPEKVSSNRSHSQHDKYMCEMKENYTKFMLHWEYIKKKNFGSTCTANGRVCIASPNRNKSFAFIST